MKSKKSWFLLLPLIILIAYFSGNCSQTQGDPTSKESHLLKLVYENSQRFHYAPPVIDDSYSQKAFEDFLVDMDSGKRFYTQKDVKQLEKYKNDLDDHFKEGKLEFFDLSLKLIDEGIKKSQTYYQEFINAPFDFTKDEKIELDAEKRKWASDDKEMKDYWRKSIKYERLSRYIEDHQQLEKEGKKRPEDSIQMDINKEVKDVMDGWFDRLSKLKRSDRFELFVNTFIHLYDPHTDYLNPKEKEDFNINMSGKLEGIGARLQTEREFTKVSSIVPGGPAARQGELEANDLIIGVQQDGLEPVDIKGMRIDDVVSKIRGKKGTKVTLKVKKQDGNQKNITITRDEVIMDEGFARSAILELEGDQQKIGFIRLPRFYADFNDPQSPSAAKDIAIELEKLNQAGVTSLILDLRNNGGGSLQEVVDMSGLFIEEGPIVQVKDKRGTRAYNDQDKNVKFTGPMVILVNSNSASASEIISACLQDYKRAVIVGGEPTFGKGTVQQFRNLDQFTNYPEMRPLGEMKVTIQKYYRVNGGSVQLKGVEPDVLLPDTYSYIINGEKEYDHPLPYDVIEKQKYYQNTFLINNIEEVKMKSMERVKSNTEFNLIDENAKRLAKNREESEYPLELNKYKSLVKQRTEEVKKYEKIGTTAIPGIKTDNLKEDLAYIKADSSRIARNDDFLKGLTKDVYVYESMHILKDLHK
ncbi:MAG: carboxy terminal-processing peptidase [Saprospiraceae bacterium]|nr:carboxy terminal-processing peptidase [Saprospiraceae bacterium]MBK8451161.1 carboxy terminal-processing peptidase [Saprospiraceae bacterium]MBK9722520.1 carboxy terminal-processing peptidase [Saprospiraceae bacterium]MBK9729539.1 carboxy terminal-processing peptidase [Saprospiraceae bacterium]